RRARIRPFRPRRSSDRCLRHRTGQRHRRDRRAHRRAAQTCRTSRSGASHPYRGQLTRAMKILFIGDIVGKPGRELIRKGLRGLVVDFHPEATSEKVAMGWHLDGKVTLVVGTHTHVQTADERILPNGTAYMTDAGMTGPHDSIIGMEREPSLARFLNAMPSRFEPASGNARLNGAVIVADEKTGRATKITRISYSSKELDELSLRPAV